MNDELFTMFLALVFAAVMVIAGQMFTAQRNRHEAVLLLESVAVSLAHRCAEISNLALKHAGTVNGAPSRTTFPRSGSARSVLIGKQAIRFCSKYIPIWMLF